MQVRGSVIKGVDQFIADNHKGDYEVWKKKLPSTTVHLMKTATSSSWYPVVEGLIVPMEIVCDMFYNKDIKGAWKAGRYSAEMALTGIYKVFVMVATPKFMMKRASRIVSTFYDPANIEVVHSTSNSMVLQTSQLFKNEILEHRMAGWMEKALEICGCNDLSVNITKSIAKGSDVFEVSITWT